MVKIWKPKICCMCNAEFVPTSSKGRWCSVRCHVLHLMDVSHDPDACWMWLGVKNELGYGRLTVGRHPGRRRLPAHRLVFEVVSGGILTPGQVVRHLCDNPSCVNPSHLLAGTQAENVADMIEKGRAKHASGSLSSKAKINEQCALEIFHATGSNSQIAARFGVIKQLVVSIKRGYSWSHVTGMPKWIPAHRRRALAASLSSAAQ